eukprot:TRINITY_DN35542_c0_g1_i1.p1 TRINITY_DN35542_c0_g1~~TRINITY_DN35542_c0_g1_i1.p1  ORF type:complete len:1524 (+),score=500.20 TRINITY_DN35542_c0_g1_i1:65-4636(+)
MFRAFLGVRQLSEATKGLAKSREELQVEREKIVFKRKRKRQQCLDRGDEAAAKRVKVDVSQPEQLWETARKTLYAPTAWRAFVAILRNPGLAREGIHIGSSLLSGVAQGLTQAMKDNCVGCAEVMRAIADALILFRDDFPSMRWVMEPRLHLMCASFRLAERIANTGTSKGASEEDVAAASEVAVLALGLTVRGLKLHGSSQLSKLFRLFTQPAAASQGSEVARALKAAAAIQKCCGRESPMLAALEDAMRSALFLSTIQWLRFFSAYSVITQEEGDEDLSHVKEGVAEDLGRLLADPATTWHAVVSSRAAEEHARRQEAGEEEEGFSGHNRKMFLNALFEGVFANPKLLTEGWAPIFVRVFARAINTPMTLSALWKAEKPSSPETVATLRFIAVLIKYILMLEDRSELSRLIRAVRELGVYHSQTDLLYHSGSGFFILSPVAAQLRREVGAARERGEELPGWVIPTATDMLLMYHKLVEKDLDVLCAAAVASGTADGHGFVSALLQTYGSLQNLDVPVAALAKAELQGAGPSWLCGRGRSVYTATLGAGLDPLPTAEAALEQLAPRVADGGTAYAAHLAAVARALPIRVAGATPTATWVDSVSSTGCRPLADRILSGQWKGKERTARVTALLELYWAVQDVLDRAAPQLLLDVFEWGSGVLPALLGGSERASATAPEDVRLVLLSAAKGGSGGLKAVSLRELVGGSAGLAGMQAEVQCAAGMVLYQRAWRLRRYGAIRSWQPSAEPETDTAAELLLCVDGLVTCLVAALRRTLAGSAVAADAEIIRDVCPKFADLAAIASAHASDELASALVDSIAAEAPPPAPEPVLMDPVDLAWRALSPSTDTAEAVAGDDAGAIARGVVATAETWECEASCDAVLKAAAAMLHRGGAGPLRAARCVLAAMPTQCGARVPPGLVEAVQAAAGARGPEAAVARDCVTCAGAATLDLTLGWARTDDKHSASEAERAATVRAAAHALFMSRVSSEGKIEMAEFKSRVVQWCTKAASGARRGPCCTALVALGLLRLSDVGSTVAPAPSSTKVRDTVRKLLRGTEKVAADGPEARLAASLLQLDAAADVSTGVCVASPYVAGAALIALRVFGSAESQSKAAHAAAAAFSGDLDPAPSFSKARLWLASIVLTEALPLLQPELQCSVCISSVKGLIFHRVESAETLAASEDADAVLGVLRGISGDGVFAELLSRLSALASTKGSGHADAVNELLGVCGDAFRAAAASIRNGEPLPPLFASAAELLSDFIATCPGQVKRAKAVLRNVLGEAFVALNAATVCGSDRDVLRPLLRVATAASVMHSVHLTKPQMHFLLQLPEYIVAGDAAGPGFAACLLRIQKILLSFVQIRLDDMSAFLWPQLITAVGTCIRGLLRWVQRDGGGARTADTNTESIKELAGVDSSTQANMVMEAALVDVAMRLLETMPGARRVAGHSPQVIALSRAHAPALLMHVLAACVDCPVAADRHHRDIARGAAAVLKLCDAADGPGLETVTDHLPAAARPVFKAFYQQHSMRLQAH